MFPQILKYSLSDLLSVFRLIKFVAKICSGICSDLERNKRYTWKASALEDIKTIRTTKSCREICMSRDDCLAWNNIKEPYYRCRIFNTYFDDSNKWNDNKHNLGSKECGACTKLVTDFT